MTKAVNKARRYLGPATRSALIIAAVVAPILAVQGVRAGTSQFIGEAQTMSSGAGLVLFVSLKRS